MPGRDPYPQLLGGGGPILRPRPLDGRPALAAPAVPGVVESGPPMQSRSSTWANIKWFQGGWRPPECPRRPSPPRSQQYFFLLLHAMHKKKNNLREVLRFSRGF